MSPLITSILVSFLTISHIGCSGLPKVASAEFPGRRSLLLSPNGVFAVRNVDADSKHDQALIGDNHAMCITNRLIHQEYKFYTYSRHVAVKWSPDSQKIAITDFDGSNHATCRIAFVSSASLIDVESAIKQAFAAKHTDLAASHIYFTASAWISSTLLKVKVVGYDLPGGHDLERTYYYDLATHEVRN